MHAALIPSPLGPLSAAAEHGRRPCLYTNRDVEAPAATGGVLAEAQRQLGEYFEGTRTTFDLPLEQGGTPFEQAVWAKLAEIPYGSTRTYGEIARELDSSPRAVGRANGRN